MLPVSLRLVYALNSATFQVSSLALLSIVNTRVSIPAEYLPAYGAISFLPYSLRPIFAWVSSWLLRLSDPKTANENSDRHDKLLFPAFLLASLSFVGTVFIPSGGIVLCFLWGFLRGIAGAWSDFLIGMSVIEFSKLQVGGANATYEHVVSVNTAQSSTAKNLGSFVASITTFAFFAKHGNLGETVANTLLLGTAAIFLLASLVSLKFQFHVNNLMANLEAQGYNIVNSVEGEHLDETASVSSTNGMYYTSSSSRQSPILLEQSGSDTVPSDDSEEGTISSTLLPEMEESISRKGPQHRRQIVEVSTLIAFQILLAVSALQKPIIAVSNQSTWISLVVTFAITLIFIIALGYRYERQSMLFDPLSSKPCASSSPPFGHQDRKLRSQNFILPHRQLNLYFLLRYSLPIAGFLMYSYLYSVFESEPIFLQLLSVLKTAIGSLATFCYEKFLSPYCHSGWPLIGLIASLDIIMGLVALLDVWVIRVVKEKEVDGEYSVDTPLRCLVIAVGLAKYFFAELDYLPALVLSTTNVYSHKEVRFERREDGETAMPEVDIDDGDTRANVYALSIDSNNEEDSDIARPSMENSVLKLPAISAGMQYASFLSCIDFGAQIGDWITVPIVSSLNITRENHWDHLDKLVILCSIFRMTRVTFLWLICPPIGPQCKVTNVDHNNNSNVNDESE